MNCIQLVGNIGQDPEIRYFENGTMLVEMSIAVRRFKKEEPPIWIRLKAWGKQGQFAADYVKKGSLVGVSGRIEEEVWVDSKTGLKKSKHSVTVNQIELIGSRPANQNQEEAPF